MEPGEQHSTREEGANIQIDCESYRANVLLWPIDRPSRQKLNRTKLELTKVINQIDLTDIYRAFHPNTKEYTFFTAPRRTFSKTFSDSKQVSSDTRKLK